MTNQQVMLAPQLKAHHHPLKLMGCGFVLTAVDRSPQRAWDAIRAAEQEIIRIEQLISSWKDDSETAEINANAGKKAVQVSKELFDLIARSIKVSEITGGAFDISGTLARYYWNFNNEVNQMLSEAKIIELRDRINYRLIELDSDKQTVFLQKERMKIGFGGIGKGYAAHRAKQMMQSMGIQSGLINASGDLACWGTPPKREDWSINIPNPSKRDESLLRLFIPNGAVVTSGSSEHYTIIDGAHYSHIIDPRTGRPVKETKSVSVICPNPELADALATAISVMGAEAGIKLINRLNGIECIVIEADNTIHYSNYLKSFAA